MDLNKIQLSRDFTTKMVKSKVENLMPIYKQFIVKYFFIKIIINYRYILPIDFIDGSIIDGYFHQ